MSPAIRDLRASPNGRYLFAASNTGDTWLACRGAEGEGGEGEGDRTDGSRELDLPARLLAQHAKQATGIVVV